MCHPSFFFVKGRECSTRLWNKCVTIVKETERNSVENEKKSFWRPDSDLTPLLTSPTHTSVLWIYAQNHRIASILAPRRYFLSPCCPERKLQSKTRALKMTFFCYELLGRNRESYRIHCKAPLSTFQNQFMRLNLSVRSGKTKPEELVLLRRTL